MVKAIKSKGKKTSHTSKDSFPTKVVDAAWININGDLFVYSNDGKGSIILTGPGWKKAIRGALAGMMGRANGPNTP